MTAPSGWRFLNLLIDVALKTAQTEEICNVES